jgi:FecR protein
VQPTTPKSAHVDATQRPLRSRIALLLCFFLSLSGDQGFCDVHETASTTKAVGKVTAVRSGVTQSGSAVKVNDVIRAKENVKTDDSGRLSVDLLDGSKLGIGSQTELTVVDHDPAAGKTLVNLSNGRLRSRVPKSPGSGTFAITTPHGTITALGTDFFLDVTAHSTQLIVYSGVVLVNSTSSSPDLDGKLVLDVVAGQNVLIDDSGIRSVQLTPNGVEQQSIAETMVPETSVRETIAQPVAVNSPPVATKPSHALRNILIGGLAAGAVIGAVIGLRGSKSQSTPSGTPSVPTIPAQ